MTTGLIQSTSRNVRLTVSFFCPLLRDLELHGLETSGQRDKIARLRNSFFCLDTFGGFEKKKKISK